MFDLIEIFAAAAISIAIIAVILSYILANAS